MFGSLKNKLGDVADLKKYASPQALSSLTGSRQRSQQHTPGSQTPLSRHSRQPSVTSLQGLPESPVQSLPSNQTSVPPRYDQEVEELQREISKLKAALESQQDVALQRFNAKEQEWKSKQKDQEHKIAGLQDMLNKSKKQEEKLKKDLMAAHSLSRKTERKLSETKAKAKDFETKVVELQEDYDQLEGLSTQEAAKVKHLLLNTTTELQTVKEKLEERTAALTSCEVKLESLPAIEERLKQMSEEKTELESQVAGLQQKLSAATARCSSLEAEKEEEANHLQEKISILEQRNSQATLMETDKVQALIKERKSMEHRLEESRQQLNNIKTSWSNKISSLETQIEHLNSKMAEDQNDMKSIEEEKSSLQVDLEKLTDEKTKMEEEKNELEMHFKSEVAQLKEDLETSHWQLKTAVSEKDQEIKQLKDSHKFVEDQLSNLTSDLEAKDSELVVSKEEFAKLECNYLEVTEKLKKLESDLSCCQSSCAALQENLHKERSLKEELEEEHSATCARLETVSSERAKLSHNLDEYLNRVTVAEDAAALLRSQIQQKEQQIHTLQSSLAESIERSSSLEMRVRESELNLQAKIEESDRVKDLQEQVRTLQHELSEKNQTIRVQSQRLADMKKTLQRELKLTGDAVDSSLEARVDSRNISTSPVPMLPLQLTAGRGNLTGHHPSVTVHTHSTSNGLTEFDPVNLEYLKHVVIKFITSREYEAVQLTRAVATLLHMSRAEEELLRETLEWKMSWFGPRPNLGKGQHSLTIPPSH